MNHYWSLSLAIVAVTLTSGCASLPSLRRDLAERSPRGKDRQESAIAAFEAQRDAAQLQAALSRWNEGNEAACEQLLTALVDRKPEYADARLQLAELHLYRGELELAEQHLREALKHAPQRAELHDCLARVLEAGSRSSESSVHFQKAAELDPSGVGSLAATR